jgi:predicted transcriptional regulator
MTLWRARPPQSPSPATRLGPLERRVLDALWARATPASVRDLQPAFDGIAYTTLMTTLDRLFRKGVLDREKDGRAFAYRVRLSRAEYEAARVREALDAALAAEPGRLGPLLSFFVDAVSERDRELLDELEALVRARRDAIDAKR